MKAAVIAFTSNGCGIALKVREALSGDDVTIQCKTNHDSDGIEHINCSSSEWTRRRFSDSDAIIFVGATGIAVRLIAPYVKSKDTDPAVVCIDEHGKFTIALLSGHIGGCNRLAERIATGIGSVPVITTATDLNGKFAVDVFATDNRLRITDLRKAQETSSRILSGKFIGFSSEFPVSGGLPDGLTETDSGEFGLRISCDSGESPFDTTFNLVPEDIVLGIGCRRNTDPEKMYRFITDLLNGDGIDPCRVGCVASIDLKSDEKAILELASRLRCPAVFFTSEELMSLSGKFSSSEFVKSVTAVDCVCERSAVKAGNGTLIRRKTALDGMTAAICKTDFKLRF